MSLNTVVSAERIHIAFFGKRNAGKSSLVNAVAGQETAVVSAVAGTTTDPVKKSMELLPLGPVVIIDTAGFDDDSEIGSLRVRKTREVAERADIAVLVADSREGADDVLGFFADTVKGRDVPFVVVHSKADLLDVIPDGDEKNIWVSAEKGINIDEFKNMLGRLADRQKPVKRITDGLLESGATAVLVIPIDEGAPKGRLILPQQQTIRDILERGAAAVVCQPNRLPGVLRTLAEPPEIVITDSQVFAEVDKMLPPDIALTSFSILFARYKGELKIQLDGAAVLSHLENNDRILICEGCTHHRQCGDIGTVKLPKMIRRFSSADVSFDFVSGSDFPEKLENYKLIVHCGGCMLTETEMKRRLTAAANAGVPITNYGMVIACVNGILKRSLEPFGEII